MSERETALKEHISRVRLMSKDDGETWDLSENDRAALKAVLAALPVAGADPVPVCQWRETQAGGWTNACADDGKPQGFWKQVNNLWGFCPYCGKPLALVPAEGETC